MMNQNDQQRLHAGVTGRVQGVVFRYYVVTEAAGLGLNGWVRNRRDGSVEVMAEGTKEKLTALHRNPRELLEEENFYLYTSLLNQSIIHKDTNITLHTVLRKK